MYRNMEVNKHPYGSEKAHGLIMNAGLGYVLIQLSPLLLKILEAAGNAVQLQ